MQSAYPQAPIGYEPNQAHLPYGVSQQAMQQQVQLPSKQAMSQAMPPQAQTLPQQTMPAQAQTLPQQAAPQQAMPQQAQMPPQAAPAQAQMPPQPPYQAPAAAQQAPGRLADVYSKASAAFVVAGLLLFGAALVPLTSFLNMTPALEYFIGLAYLAVVFPAVGFMSQSLFAASPRREEHARIMRIAVLVAGEVGVVLLASAQSFEYRWESSFIVLALVLIAAYLFCARRGEWRSYAALRVNEIVVVLLMAPSIALAGVSLFSFELDTVSSACYGIVTAAVMAIAALRAHELVADNAHPQSRNAGFLVMTAIAVTFLAAAYLEGCTPLSGNVYAFDILFLVSALACTALGFAGASPALRRTGLAIGFTAIAKMIVIDTLGFDPLSKAVAYLVGGMVCIAIGFLYNRAVKRIAAC